MLTADFALFNVDQLVTVAPDSHPAAQGDLGIISRAALAAREGQIVWVGPMAEFHQAVTLTPDAAVLNTHGRTVLPGFVDPHTHPVFAGDRAADFYARASGQTYDQQLEPGIMRTVRATRQASEDTLLSLAFARAGTFLAYGTTTIEAKSGYGLTRDDELKALRVLTRLQRLCPLKIVPAFLGAHVIPTDYPGDADRFTAEIAEDWLSAAHDYARICDVWCDPGAFTTDQCRHLLEHARALGFDLTLHASELEPGGGVRLAAELGALSVDHAVYLSDDDVAALAASRTIPVLLPGTTFFLGSDAYAPARRLLDAGIPVALGTDFNPGTSYTQNMQFILSLAVLKLGMSSEEAIRGATINAARAIGLEDRVGSLVPGKFCDFVAYRVPDYRLIPYHYAMNQAETVVAGGRVVARDGAPLATAAPVAAAS